MARLAALVPPPRMRLPRYHGVFTPHSKLRAAVTPGHRGGARRPCGRRNRAPPTPRHVAMSWARRLRRAFGIEIERCAGCGGRLEIIAGIEEPKVIAKILAHLESTVPERYSAAPAAGLPVGTRAPRWQPVMR